MIRTLSIADLGVIASTELELGPGLTVLTGETGAGKTLVTTAIAQLLGAKSDVGLIRHGATDAVIDGLVSLRDVPQAASMAEDLGAIVEDDCLLVSRIIGTRSRAIVGGRPVAAAVLGDLMATFVTLHGQHGQTRLMKASEQRRLLDASSPEIAVMLPVVRDAWVNLRDAASALADARAMASDAARDLSAFQAFVDDVDGVAPDAGEDVALDARIATLTSLDAILQSTNAVLALLTDSGVSEQTDAHTLLVQARKMLEHRHEDPKFSQWSSRLIEMSEALQGITIDIERFISALDAEPGAMDALMHRRAEIGALLRRWNMDLEGLLRRYSEATQAIALARDPQQQLQEMEILAAHCETEFAEACNRLRAMRVSAASSLSTRVTNELHALDLPHAHFTVLVTEATERSQFGADDVSFQFTANPGLPAQALSAVGSGGELSRVMLALETAVAQDSGGTLIFDEVDAGVGGRAALEVGRRLADLARRHQVIVVTHLAQVAAYADAHILVSKQVSNGETLTETRMLHAGERPRELARMLSGIEDSETATAHARELLESASAARRM